jgi:hypothetical protein
LRGDGEENVSESLEDQGELLTGKWFDELQVGQAYSRGVLLRQSMTRIFVLVWLLTFCCVQRIGAQESEAPSQVQDQRGTEKNPLVVTGEIKTSVPAPPAPSPEDSAAEKQKTSDAHLLTVATVKLEVWAFLLTIIAAIQIAMFIVQLQLTKSIARTAKSSADALPRIERAYVFVDIAVSREAREELKDFSTVTFSFAVKLTNYGKTPAILTKMSLYPVLEDTPPKELMSADSAEPVIPDGMVIGPGASHEMLIGKVLDPGQYAEFESLAKSVYVVGLVDYDDMMGGSRSTGFCWYTRPSENAVFVGMMPSPLNHRS